ncbi:MAG: magnesium transporter CorA family protein [Spirochaetes bacterium]|nr:magnesium transporter CorA family protein [Spirochaetota bacterium]
MIRIYRKNKETLEQLNNIDKDCWINLVNPQKEELEELSKSLNIPHDFLTDPLDPDERSRIETDEGSTLIILRVPQFQGTDAEISFVTLPVGIIIKDDSLITLYPRENEIIEDFIKGKVKSFSTSNKNRFILQIFLRTAIIYLKHLKEINKRTNGIEKELHKSMKNEELIKLLNMEKSLVYFTTSLRSNEIMMERLLKIKILKMKPDDIDFLEDAIVENKQAIEMANIYSNILSGMMDAFASVISNNLNVVMKYLTAITIILMLPTLVASFYGMNVNLPLEKSPYAFLFTIGISLILSITGVIIFIKRKWF